MYGGSLPNMDKVPAIETEPTLHGYSSADPRSILARLRAGGTIADVDGDFVISGCDGDGEFLLSSLLSAIPYYYAVSASGMLIHGRHAFDVARRAERRWNWNFRALGSLAWYGHTLNDDTLCDTVSRMPAGARVSLRRGELHIEKLPIPEFHWDHEGSAELCLGSLEQAFADCVTSNHSPHLSLSAGYDSRLLLALAMKKGLLPVISVMGTSDSTDVRVAGRICARLGVPLQIVDVPTTAYLEQGARIAWETSGVKTAVNWHTYIYAGAIRASDSVHLVGSNGEFARSFYFDVRRLNWIVDRTPPGAIPYYWFLRILRRMKKFSKHNPLLQQESAARRYAALGTLDRRWKADSAASALDAFYSEQRVRHFIGSGIACYGAHGNPRSPFLDARWLRTCASMTRALKRNNRFHEIAIKRLAPELSNEPFNCDPEMGKVVGYNPFPNFASSNEIKDFIIDSRQLDAWSTREQRERIMVDPGCSQLEERNFWITLHFAAIAASRQAPFDRTTAQVCGGVALP